MVIRASTGRIHEGSMSGCGSINHVNLNGECWNGELHSNRSVVWWPTAMNGVRLLNVPSPNCTDAFSPCHVTLTRAPSSIVRVALEQEGLGGVLVQNSNRVVHLDVERHQDPIQFLLDLLVHHHLAPLFH